MREPPITLTRAQALELVRHCGHWRPGDPAFAWSCNCCQHTADESEQIHHAPHCAIGAIKAQLDETKHPKDKREQYVDDPPTCAECGKPAVHGKWYGGGGLTQPIRLCQEHAEQFEREARAKFAKFREEQRRRSLEC